MPLVSTMELDATATVPFAPEVPETRLSLDPLESVKTLAVTPTPEELISEARVASVPPPDGNEMVWPVPLPTRSVIEPVRVSDALGISVM